MVHLAASGTIHPDTTATAAAMRGLGTTELNSTYRRPASYLQDPRWWTSLSRPVRRVLEPFRGHKK